MKEEQLILVFNSEGIKVLMLNDRVSVLAVKPNCIFVQANVGGYLSKFNASLKWHKLMFERRESNIAN